MIEAQNISKIFDDKVVIQQVSATFRSGECSLVIGKSGAGKTVLLKSIVGLIPPSSGKVLYDGQDLHQLRGDALKQLRQEVGMLFQGSALFDSMTLLENVMFPLDIFSNLSTAQRIEIAQDKLQRVKLYEARHKYPAEVSGGMMKRTAIARAIVLNPRYLFCDEPNSGLDPQTSRHIDELIYSLTHEYGMTTIVNTHDMKSVTNIGDHVLFLHKGVVAWEGRGSEIDQSDNERLKHFVFVSSN